MKTWHITYLISIIDPLKYILQKLMPTGMLDNWKILLTEFDIKYGMQKSINVKGLAYYLAENFVDEEYKLLKTNFANEKMAFIREDISNKYDGQRLLLMTWKISKEYLLALFWSQGLVNIIKCHLNSNSFAPTTWLNVKLAF